ncbi:Conserved oligomeric Golgi complex subunit 4 [Plasmodiophora brassicae]|uniref:Conserved oligomeric Golgi complex subunit 4 n=1 Tax=Plasmodiophora brassicae TaxID=37360 RepID=A0A0G4IIZ1_PLABS|nr:hypothetical protein PBRA_003934 [Plasmodiophora brassicae]SPQ96385.1 unnamed protein product [Plasmodiophora brassicae]
MALSSPGHRPGQAGEVREAGSSRLLSELEQCRNVDVELAERLQALLDQRQVLMQSSVLAEIAANSLGPVDESLRNAAPLVAKVGGANTLATAISSKVRELDCAQSRLRLALEQVDLVLDLKTAIEAVRSALVDNNFEEAAKHTSRMLRQYRRRKAASDLIIDNIEDDEDVSFRVLIGLEAQLRSAIQDRFNKSTSDEETLRYCRLLSLVGLTGTGLVNYCDVLGRRLDEQLKMLKSRNTLERLTGIFDMISDFIRDHEKQLQQDFGLGAHLRLAQIMQKCADVHVVPLIKKFLTQRNLSELASQLNRAPRSPGAGGAEHPVMDPRDLDVVLDEIARITSECEMFDMDLRAAFTHGANTMKENSPELYEEMSKSEDGTKMVAVSGMNVAVQEVIGHYVALEHYYMVSNVEKAMAEPSGILPGAHTSVFVDDVFYIVKTSGSRALNTHSMTSAIAVLNNINSLLEHTYTSFIRDRIHVTQAAALEASSVFFTGRAEHDATVAEELVALNNADTSAQNVVLLKEFFDSELKQIGPKDPYDAIIEQCLVDLAQIARLLRREASAGISKHMKSIQSDLIPYCDKFEAVSYEITEAQFNAFNVDDPYVQKLIMACEQYFEQIRPNVTSSVMDGMVLNLASFIATRISLICFNKMFTFHGGLQVDKDVRSLIAFFSQMCSKSVRDKFLRLSQIASLLQLYDVKEVNELRVEASDSEFWRLSPPDVKKILKRRKEFSHEKFDALSI